MKKLSIFSTKNQVYLYDGVKGEEIFNLKEYKDVFKEGYETRHNFFDTIVNDYKVTEITDIKDNFLYLFNMILISNVTNYIIDRYQEEEIQEITFDKSIENSKTKVIKFNDYLSIDDFLGGIVIALVNSESYLEKGMKIDYGIIQNKKNLNIDKDKNLEYFFRYNNSKISDYIKMLDIDLVAFGFVEKDKKNKEGRYSLPVYVDHEGLMEKQLENYGDFLDNWKSIAYLNMLIKIHDFFTDYYKLEESKGELVSDDLMLALIYLLDYEEKQMPIGLEKSLEVGRQTSGKCYIIDTVQRPISLPEKLALTLQAKDVFSIVPKIYLNNI